MRILSIDFDYFIDTDMETRVMCFPDGHDNFAPALTQFIWNSRYDFHENIRDLGVIADYDKMCDFLKSRQVGRVLIADSHREIAQFFDSVKPDEDLEIINIDFHHDMYITGGSTLDCGNWLRFLADLKPDADIKWVMREDSDTEALTGEFPYATTTNIDEVQGEFDLIFICFSSPWTPPHLKPRFDEMCKCVEHLEQF